MSRIHKAALRSAGALLLSVSVLVLSGCLGETRVDVASEVRKGDVASCGGADCHDDALAVGHGGPHGELGCVTCHEAADGDHAADPDNVIAATDWRIDACATCHEGEAKTYLYDDNAKAGVFGGSIREPAQPKSADFPLYGAIVAGHAFAKDYAEEGAHRWMLRDHYDTTRGKADTCVQCKSTKVAYAWSTGMRLSVPADLKVTLEHTASETRTAAAVTVPEGTTLRYATDATTGEYTSFATLPDGTIYTSHEPTDEGTRDLDWTWAATIAATQETGDYGAGCNHCHDPHSGQPRLVRGAMLTAIENGGPAGAGGMNPYAAAGAATAKTLDETSARDRENAVCTQCHVEYTCGKSGVDGKVRDAFGWGKAKDLHNLYTARFGYTQDWTQALIGEPLIKSQHPEAELYWNSPHYTYGVSCVDCHMPEVVGADGESFRSHWMTSPYKYGKSDLYRGLAQAASLSSVLPAAPCARCHEDRTTQGIAAQQSVYARQEVVQELLARSAEALGAAREAKESGGRVDDETMTQAVEAHRKAHVLWENLIVSENSMGFHNIPEVLEAMDAAETSVREALELTEKAFAKK